MSGWGYALKLSKEEVKNAEPPGTVKLIDHELHRTPTGTNYNEDHIQLVPHPSRSPADPLNWPKWRKLAVLFTVSLYALIANIASANIASALPLLTFQLLPPNSLTRLGHLVAYNVLFAGCSNIVWVPLANIFGRRPIMLLAQLILIFASMGGGLATTFNGLLIARIFQGIGAGPEQTISPEIVGEVFFVHQRGRAMALYTVCLSGGSLLGGIIGGYIAGNLGYKYIFWITTALSVFIFLCQFFLVPETLFDRKSHLAHEERNNTYNDEKEGTERTEQAINSKYQSKFGIAQQLSVGMYRGHIVRRFIAPWKTLALPGTWVVMLHYGGLVGAIVTLATIAPALLSAPPYLWGNNVGLINVAGLIGCIVGGIATHFTADLLVTRGAKKEVHGFSEPEARLPAMFPALVIAVAGIWCFGFSAANGSKPAWVGMAFGLGMVSFGLTQIPSIGFNYLIEAYYSVSSDCFVMTTIVRGVISFAWTFFVVEWVFTRGPREPFGIFGMLMAIFALLTIPLWIYGKRWRIATAKYLPKVGEGEH
ncbi:hypothetical protein B0A48_02215 [Cryoendolithus antarcticus]|uniref:Major facilitator superfamily (MFS) profile domain-containing protein n=1 Tax=Cryoendolithus antarcticus TaxID=1507870 RepID=A0A1V8TNB7_9PEZI|nr:hypothetical protein B0A48_02215 [Cryoendolithus antarcticus]